MSHTTLAVVLSLSMFVFFIPSILKKVLLWNISPLMGEFPNMKSYVARSAAITVISLGVYVLIFWLDWKVGLVYSFICFAAMTSPWVRRTMTAISTEAAQIMQGKMN